MLIVGSPAQRIALAMRWFGQNFAEKTGVDALATQVGMSPLQYQKQLRLQKAKELMLNASIDIANAAARVGYVSLSQFSREYKRFFRRVAAPRRSPGNERRYVKGDGRHDFPDCRRMR
jgi:transcriptional regulator GlxA family with amidase domain